MKRSDLKKLFDISGQWTRISDEQAVLSAYDYRNQGYWEIVADAEGNYHLRTRPSAYSDDDDLGYLDGSVSMEPSSKATLSAAKKAARSQFEALLMKVAVREGRAPTAPVKHVKVVKVVKEPELPRTYPITGHYSNDCPFCHTHNALLGDYRGDYTCRDCKRVFRNVTSGGVDKWQLQIAEPVVAHGRYLYKPLYRPASFATVPKGWDYAEAPAEYAPNRTDVPRSKHKFGIIAYERPLTEEEMEHFSLERME